MSTHRLELQTLIKNCKDCKTNENEDSQEELFAKQLNTYLTESFIEKETEEKLFNENSSDLDCTDGVIEDVFKKLKALTEKTIENLRTNKILHNKIIKALEITFDQLLGKRNSIAFEIVKEITNMLVEVD